MAAVWFELVLEVPLALSEAVANFLAESGAPGLQLDEHGASVSLIAYYASAPRLDSLKRYCADLGSPLESGAVRVREIAEQDWAENWKLNFVPQVIGQRLCVCPPWEVAAPPNRVVIVIEPGMAFGTGQHATTQGCLEGLERAVQTRSIGLALDVGTGSGILAIALAKLGVPNVWAVDVDPQALAIAEANAASNAVQGQITFSREIDAIAGPVDLLVANLFTNLLLEGAERFARVLAPGGLLVCSGFLQHDAASIEARYAGLGFRLAWRHDQAGWVTLALERPTLP